MELEYEVLPPTALLVSRPGGGLALAGAVPLVPAAAAPLERLRGVLLLAVGIPALALGRHSEGSVRSGSSASSRDDFVPVRLVIASYMLFSDGGSDRGG